MPTVYTCCNARRPLLRHLAAQPRAGRPASYQADCARGSALTCICPRSIRRQAEQEMGLRQSPRARERNGRTRSARWAPRPGMATACADHVRTLKQAVRSETKSSSDLQPSRRRASDASKPSNATQPEPEPSAPSKQSMSSRSTYHAKHVSQASLTHKEQPGTGSGGRSGGRLFSGMLSVAGMCLIDVALCTLDERVRARVEVRRDLVDVHAPSAVLALTEKARRAVRGTAESAGGANDGLRRPRARRGERRVGA
jgi:hypothetical protein